MTKPRSRSSSAAGAAVDALRELQLPEVCRAEHLAGMTDLPPFLIEREIAEGRLSGRRVGNVWLVHRQSVRRWLGGSTAEAEAVLATLLTEAAGDAGASRSEAGRGLRK